MYGLFLVSKVILLSIFGVFQKNVNFFQAANVHKITTFLKKCSPKVSVINGELWNVSKT